MSHIYAKFNSLKFHLQIQNANFDSELMSCISLAAVSYFENSPECNKILPRGQSDWS